MISVLLSSITSCRADSQVDSSYRLRNLAGILSADVAISRTAHSCSWPIINSKGIHEMDDCSLDKFGCLALFWCASQTVYTHQYALIRTYHI